MYILYIYTREYIHVAFAGLYLRCPYKIMFTFIDYAH